MSEILFSATCDEPEGVVVRNVYSFKYSMDNLKLLWEKTKQFPVLLGHEIQTFDDFLRCFILIDTAGNIMPMGILMIVDDFVGAFILKDIDWPREASIHYTFFDRRHKGRLDLCATAIRYVFDRYNFQKLYTKIPLYAKGSLNFVEKLGLKKEGRIRNNALFRGKYYDVNYYGILKEEAKDALYSSPSPISNVCRR